MTRWIPPWDAHRYRQPTPPAPTHPPAVTALLADEFRSREYGSYGATLPAPAPEPLPPPQTPFVIEPVDWEQELGDRINDPPETTTPLQHGGAVAELMAQDNGFDPPAPGPGPATTPLQPLRFEEPDWRREEAAAAEETKRAQLEHARRLLEEAALAEEQPGYPPVRREPA